MSSVVVSTSAALGRPFLFDAESEADEHPASSAKKRVSAGMESTQVVPSTIRSAIPMVTPASRLAIRPAPEMVTSGIPALDALAGGLPRGCLTEIYGPASSGRTSVMLAALAAATRRGEYCALIDAGDALNPQSVAPAGIDLERLLWVRCGEELPRKGNPPQRHRGTENNQVTGHGFPRIRIDSTNNQESMTTNFSAPPCLRGEKPGASEHRLEQVLRATDLLLESGGFGLIVLDLADVPPQAARRIPLTTWFRFRRAVENKPTILLAIEQQPIAGSCSSLLLQLRLSKDEPVTANESAAERRKNAAYGASRGLNPEEKQAPEGRKKFSSLEETRPEVLFSSHTYLLTGLEINAELIRSRLDRKPARSAIFETKVAWAG